MEEPKVNIIVADDNKGFIAMRADKLRLKNKIS